MSFSKVFTLEQDKKKKITKEDLEEGMKKFLGFKNKKIEKIYICIYNSSTN